MQYQLRSNNLIITIQSKGAEVSSVLLDSVEYIWQADPAIWPRHTPVLFPIVGKLKNDQCTHNGKTIQLSQHGFARDKEFKLIRQTNEEIVFELMSDEETIQIYPFDFKLLISYKITNNELNCSYQVINLSSERELLFSIGAHPGFRVPLTDSEKFTDYSLKFESNKTFVISKLSQGLLSGAKSELNLISNELHISKDLFEHDALVFEDSQINSIILHSNKSGKGVEMTCKNWPYFGIWAKKDCEQFVCLEPWYGITDTNVSNGELKNKKGIIQLDPKQEFNCNYSIRFF